MMPCPSAISQATSRARRGVGTLYTGMWWMARHRVAPRSSLHRQGLCCPTWDSEVSPQLTTPATWHVAPLRHGPRHGHCGHAPFQAHVFPGHPEPFGKELAAA